MWKSKDFMAHIKYQNVQVICPGLEIQGRRTDTRRPGCPIFRLQVLPHLLTRLEDGADPISDVSKLLTISE